MKPACLQLVKRNYKNNYHNSLTTISSFQNECAKYVPIGTRSMTADSFFLLVEGKSERISFCCVNACNKTWRNSAGSHYNKFINTQIHKCAFHDPHKRLLQHTVRPNSKRLHIYCICSVCIYVNVTGWRCRLYNPHYTRYLHSNDIINILTCYLARTWTFGTCFSG